MFIERFWLSPYKFVGNLGFLQIWKINNILSSANIKIGKYNSGVHCYFLISQVSSYFRLVIEVFAAQCERDIRKDIQVQQWHISCLSPIIPVIMFGASILYLLTPKSTVNGSHYLLLSHYNLKLEMQAHWYFSLMHEVAPFHR